MKTRFYPPALRPGDKVALTAPSSPVPPANLDAAVASIRMLELEPVIYPSCRMKHGYMAGPDHQRAEDLNRAFSDKTIKGIFCLRGGFGATRLLPLLDFASIKQNPKLLIGYSDVTALHTAIGNRCGFITLHGPMPNTDYRKLDAFTIHSLKTCLFAPQRIKQLENPEGFQLDTLIPGSASGPLTGGNLSLLVSTLGSPYEIDTRGKILFLEDVGERPYRLDKAMTALSLAGKFKDCCGIILGTFTECEEPPHDKVPPNTVIAQEALSFPQIIQEVILPWNKPTLSNFQAGHRYPQSTLPLGAMLDLALYPEGKLPQLKLLPVQPASV